MKPIVVFRRYLARLFILSILLFGVVSAELSASESDDGAKEENDDDSFCKLENIEVHAVFAVDCSKSLDDRQFNVAMEFAANVTRFMGNVRTIRGFLNSC